MEAPQFFPTAGSSVPLYKWHSSYQTWGHVLSVEGLWAAQALRVLGQKVSSEFHGEA